MPAGVRTPLQSVISTRVGSGSSSKGVFTVSMIRGRMKTTMTQMETEPSPSTSIGYIAAERSFSRTSRSRSAKSASDAATSSSRPAASPASTMLTCIAEKLLGPASRIAADSDEPSFTLDASPSTRSRSACDSACSATASSAGSRFSPACSATATCRSIAACCRPDTRPPKSETPGFFAAAAVCPAAPSTTSTAAFPDDAKPINHRPPRRRVQRPGDRRPGGVERGVGEVGHRPRLEQRPGSLRRQVRLWRHHPLHLSFILTDNEKSLRSSTEARGTEARRSAAMLAQGSRVRTAILRVRSREPRGCR